MYEFTFIGTYSYLMIVVIRPLLREYLKRRIHMCRENCSYLSLSILCITYIHNYFNIRTIHNFTVFACLLSAIVLSLSKHNKQLEMVTRGSR